MDLQLKIKLQFYNAFVLSALLYCCETWTLTEAHLARLRTFHNRCTRWIKGISLMDHLTNPEMHLRGETTYDIGSFIEQRRVQWVGHLARREEGYLPKMMLFAHHFGDGIRAREAGRPIQSFCQVAASSLERLGKAATGESLFSFVESALWLKLARRRVWWRLNMVKRARRA